MEDNMKKHSMGLLAIFLSVLLSVVPHPVQAQTFKALYSFRSGTDGANPYAGLTPDAAGNLYGTTLDGGVLNFGTVFRISKGGKEVVLQSFSATDGEELVAGLVRDAAGNLYGITQMGGDLACDPSQPGCGVVFKVTKTGKFVRLHAFIGGADGQRPFGALLVDQSGTLYGTTYGITYSGGTCASDSSRCGTIFKLDKGGTLTVLYNFTGSDGANPVGRLVRDGLGNLYGTTWLGGDLSCQIGGCGTVFKLDRSGKETVLHKFTARNGDGAMPNGNLLRDSAGNLYGTTRSGGAQGLYGYGTVFKLTSRGRETVLHSFAGYPADGAGPSAGVIRDSKGNLYGTTGAGGTEQWGTVFKLDPNGKLTLLHSFTNGADGGEPLSELLLDGSGNLYGTAYFGGTYGLGTAFEVTP
jgi:uncharacterized repeat protein (TIGR03803 family)